MVPQSPRYAASWAYNYRTISPFKRNWKTRVILWYPEKAGHPWNYKGGPQGLLSSKPRQSRKSSALDKGSTLNLDAFVSVCLWSYSTLMVGLSNFQVWECCFIPYLNSPKGLPWSVSRKLLYVLFRLKIRCAFFSLLVLKCICSFSHGTMLAKLDSIAANLMEGMAEVELHVPQS